MANQGLSVYALSQNLIRKMRKSHEEEIHRTRNINGKYN